MIIDSVKYTIKNQQIKTSLNEKWFECVDNRWYAERYNPLGDIYESSFEVYGLEDEITNLLLYIQEQREADTDHIMITFEGNEHPFGVNVDTTNPVKCVVERGLNSNKTTKGFRIKLTCRLLEPTFLPYSTFPGAFNFVNTGYTGDVSVTDLKHFYAYGGVVTADARSDMGFFRGTCQLTDTELVGLRNYMRLNNTDGATVTKMSGLDYLFGYESQLDYPIDVTYIQINNETELSPGLWQVGVEMYQKDYV